MICDACLTPNPVGATFCLSCGVCLRTGAARPTAERRLIHVVFCDLVGSTALSEQLDPEDLRRLLRHFRTLCTEAVSRFEGHIAQFLGDGALIYFGYPQAHEDDAQRAVRAALLIVHSVSSDTVAGHRVRVRVGVHSGLVVVGEVGVPGQRTELAVGETPTVAEHVQGQAGPDSVVMTEATERLVRGFFATEDLGARRLRGRAQPLRIFAVVGESGARSRFEAAKAADLTPFVARADEMAYLVRCWEDARRGRGRIVSVRGEAGVGKSRLVEAFKARIGVERFALVQGGCSEYLRNTAFHPLVSALEHEINSDATEGSARRPDWLEHYALRFRLAPSDAARVVSDLLSVPIEDDKIVGESHAGRRRQLTMDGLSNWLLHVEEGGPKMLVVEDLHWADASTLEVLAAISDRVAASNVLMILTFRPEFQAPTALETASAVLSLAPLGRSDAHRIASCVAHAKVLPEEVLLQLDEQTNGLPLYIEEFVKGLLESGALVENDDGFELVGSLKRSRIPETLAGPLTARIDRMSTAKPVAQWAAVLGHEFRYDMLAAISGLSPESLREAVNRLTDAEIVVERGSQSPWTLQFRHALLRDAAYESLLLADRRAIHRRTVDALREQFAEFAQNRPEIVAHHAAQAGLVELAVSEWQRACEKALAAAANREALAHIEEGTRLLERLPEGPERYERQLAFELSRGPALMAINGYQAPEVRETYQRAHALCERLGQPSRLYSVLWGLWANQFVAGELGPARGFAEQVFNLAERAQDAGLLVPAYHALGYTLCYAAEFERTLELCRAGIALFDIEIERRNTLAFQLSSTVALRQFAAVSLWMLGFPDQAREEARQAIALANSLGHPPTLAYAHSALTWGAPFLLGDFDEVDAAAREATGLSREQSFSLWPPLVRVFRGWSAVVAGATQAGLVHMREGYAAFRASGGGILRTTMLALTAEAMWRAGDAPGAMEVLSDALSAVTSTHEHNYEPELHRIRGEIMASGSYEPTSADDEAERSFRSALALARAQQARSLELRAALSLESFLRKRGRGDEGRALVREVYDWFTEGFETPDLRRARAVIG